MSISVIVLFVIVFIVGLLLGFSVAAAYYASKVRAAFGIEDRRVSVIGWLHTKEIKRGIESGKTPLR